MSKQAGIMKIHTNTEYEYMKEVHAELLKRLAEVGASLDEYESKQNA